jgi:hypothetical protein
MRLIISYVLMLIIGIGVAFGIALLVGLLWPSAKLPVFLIIAAWWCWTGWRYAQARDRGNFSPPQL